MAFTGQSFSFDGNSFESFLKVLDWDIRTPSGSIRSIPVVGLDGRFGAPTQYDSYEIDVMCLVEATSFANAIANRDTLLGLIATREGGRLIFDELSGRYYPVKFKGHSPIDRFNPKSFRVLITFRNDDPFHYAVDPATVLTLGPTSGTGSPESLNTPTISGTAKAYGIWVLKHNVASGGSKTVVLENETAKTQFTHTRSLNAGTNDWVRYTPRKHKIEYSSDGGSNYSRAPEGWSGSMPFLEPGSANALKLTSDHPITVEITFNAAYL